MRAGDELPQRAGGALALRLRGVRVLCDRGAHERRHPVLGDQPTELVARQADARRVGERDALGQPASGHGQKAGQRCAERRGERRVLRKRTFVFHRL